MLRKTVWAIAFGIVAAWTQAAFAGQQKLPTRVVALKIEQGTVKSADLVSGRPVGSIRITQGNDIVLRWTSDQAVTLHLHGYNIEIKVPANGAGEMRFRARAAGRFPVERHEPGADPHTSKTLLYVEVYPR